MFDGCFIAEFSLVWLLRFGHTDHAFEYTGISNSTQIVSLPRKGGAIMTSGFHQEEKPVRKASEEKAASEQSQTQTAKAVKNEKRSR